MAGYRTYLLKRVLIALFVLWIVMTLNFFIFRVFAPVKDPSQLILDPNMKPEVRQQLLVMWGLVDEEGNPFPLFPNQYLKYLYNLLTWQYGYSFGTSVHVRPIAPEMAWRLRNTLILLGSALVGVIAIGVPLGILAASRRGKKTDATVIGSGLFAWGVPTFFIQLIFVLFFAYWWQNNMGWTLVPGTRMTTPGADYIGLRRVIDIMWHSILPITTLVVAGFGSWALYTRNMMVEALTEDYIVTARAKGVKERAVLFRHAFKSILPPIVTIIAMAIPGLVTGAIITETIFSWPGIGKWYIDAVTSGNHPVSQAVFYNYGVLVILGNLIADLMYGYLDPRIRVGHRR